MEVIGREAARRLGLKQYFTGKPCPHGHVAFRWVAGFNCSVCLDESKKKYRADPEFHARELAYKAEYRDTNRDAVNEYARIYWRENPNAKAVNNRSKSKRVEQISEYNKSHYAANTDYFREKHAKWVAANREHWAALVARRRALKNNAEGNYSGGDVILLFSEQGGKCASCWKELEFGYHVDHVMPLALGGSNWPSNLQLLCPSCNSRKSAIHPLIWWAIINKDLSA